ncbi:MAG TPA: ATP-binding protein, partial [Deltaproteobacteria bacterium]|nr:ATP-binding protein [Deltaproteobacteria bacterium]
DTGCGIDDEDLPYIFQPFFTKKTQGTGLGLALVQKIVSVHKGDIEVENLEGAGVRFTIRLPLDQIFIDDEAG